MVKKRNDKLKIVFHGAAAIAEWLGANEEPVANSVAELRAAVCASCEHNQRGKGWKTILRKLSKKAREIKAARSDLELRTALDGELGVCEICHCALVLKVWVKLDFIEATTDEETWKQFPEWCWQKESPLPF